MPPALAEPHRKVLFNAPVALLERLDRVRKDRPLAECLRDALYTWVEAAEANT